MSVLQPFASVASVVGHELELGEHDLASDLLSVHDWSVLLSANTGSCCVFWPNISLSVWLSTSPAPVVNNDCRAVTAAAGDDDEMSVSSLCAFALLSSTSSSDDDGDGLLLTQWHVE